MSDPSVDDDDTPDDDGSTGEDVCEVLTQRLEQLRDEAWMTSVLESALAQMTSGAPAVDGYEIEYCKIKPNRDINLVAHVRLGGGAGRQLLSATVYPSAEAARAHYERDEDGRLSAATLTRLASAGYPRPVARLDEPAMILRVFPIDPLLPGLAPATDFDALRPVFAQHLEVCQQGREPLGLTYDILHYKPRRSCTLHYRLELGPAAGESGSSVRSVFGKVARDDRGERNARVLEAAWRASQACDGRWHAARPVAYLPEWRLLLQEAVSGRDFRVVFNELTRDEASEADLARVRDHLTAIVEAVRSLQSIPLEPDQGPSKTFEQLFGEQQKNLDYLGGAQPGLAAQIAEIRDELRRLERQIPRGAPVFSHGDFAHGNVLIDDGRVGIIDFDKSGVAEPAFDAAYFLTHMWSFGIRHPRRMPHVQHLWKHLRDCYLGLAPEVSPRRLALYEALDFASYVLRNFRKQSHQAGWLVWAEAQIAAAWDRLGEAAGR